MGKFPASFPSGCPSGGNAVDMTLYHGCEKAISTDEDFTPFALSSDPDLMKRGQRGGCQGWGLSVWISEEAAKHNQQLFPAWHGKRHIFKGDVTSEDGRLKDTPSRNDPHHHTFWCFEGVDIRPKFTWVLPPFQEETP